MRADAEQTARGHYLMQSAGRSSGIGRPEEYFTPKPNRIQWYRQKSNVILDDELPQHLTRALGSYTTVRTDFSVDKHSWQPPKIIKRGSVSKTFSTVDLDDCERTGRIGFFQSHTRDVHRRPNQRYEQVVYPNLRYSSQIELGKYPLSYKVTSQESQEPPVRQFAYGKPPKRFTGRNNISSFSLDYSKPVAVPGRTSHSTARELRLPPATQTESDFVDARRPATAAAFGGTLTTGPGFNPEASSGFAKLTAKELDSHVGDIYRSQSARLRFRSQSVRPGWWGDASCGF